MVLYQNSPGGSEENYDKSVKIAGLRGGSRTWNLQIKKHDS